MKKEILISGMGCIKCINHIKEAFHDIKDIKIVSVEIGKLILEGNISDDVIKKVVSDEGYEVTSIKVL